jgi:hypothetical protein
MTDAAEPSWCTEANGVHRACHLYALTTWKTDPRELREFVTRRVPGGRAKAMVTLDGQRTPVCVMSFGGHSYHVEHLVAQYRAGQELVVLEP